MSYLLQVKEFPEKTSIFQSEWPGRFKAAVS